MPQIDFTTEVQQGPLPAGFQINLESDYIALVGANNAAKTSILQILFKKYWNERDAKNKQTTCFILPEQIFVHTNTETGGRTLEQYNQELAGTIGNGNTNKSYVAPQGPASSELPKFLLNHWNFYQQLGRLNTFFRYFELPEFTLDGPQEIKFEVVQIAVQGSGL